MVGRAVLALASTMSKSVNPVGGTPRPPKADPPKPCPNLAAWSELAAFPVYVISTPRTGTSRCGRSDILGERMITSLRQVAVSDAVMTHPRQYTVAEDTLG
jgi:hypothetical protein